MGAGGAGGGAGCGVRGKRGQAGIAPGRTWQGLGWPTPASGGVSLGPRQPQRLQEGAGGAVPGPDVCWLQVPGHQGHEVGGHGVLHVEVIDALLLHVGAPCGAHQHLHPRRGLHTGRPHRQAPLVLVGNFVTPPGSPISQQDTPQPRSSHSLSLMGAPMLAVREPRFQDRETVPPSGASHAKPSLLLSGLARDWLLCWAPPSRGPKPIPG